ncbi:MAG: hypothetical protein J7599_07530 [Niabella sp.]|nr:hypothetical protein [Niabella sp.]
MSDKTLPGKEPQTPFEGLTFKNERMKGFLFQIDKDWINPILYHGRLEMSTESGTKVIQEWQENDPNKIVEKAKAFYKKMN